MSTRIKNKMPLLAGIGLSLVCAGIPFASTDTFIGNISKIEVRTPDYGGSDLNIFITVNSTINQPTKTFRIVSGATNGNAALATAISARTTSNVINIDYEASCTDFCTVMRLWY